jgi:hypothetical protein
MPATIGRCRYEYESRAIRLRSSGSAVLKRRSATTATTSKY